MSDITPATSLRLEALPDEILLEIFQYIKPIDLLSFKGHNLRLNNVIRGVKLNIVLEYSDEDFDYVMNFSPSQVISLEQRYGWEALDLHIFEALCSLTLDCTYLSKKHLNQIFSLKLEHLESISIDNVPHHFSKELLLVILDNEHFPSLKICRFTGEYYSFIPIDSHRQLPNTTVRVLILSKWYGTQLACLLTLLPNLHRFEANFDESLNWSLNFTVPHMLLADLRVTLNDPLSDLDGILQYMPNLKRLRVRGKISEDSVLEYFEKLAGIFRSRALILQRFDCELYFHSWNNQTDIIVVQKRHPLFEKIECLWGNSMNLCYSTDLTEYPLYSEYAYVETSANRTMLNYQVMNGYDSDHDYYDDNNDDDDNDGWFNNGLSYRENYKRAFMCSPWSGNNDDY